MSSTMPTNASTKSDKLELSDNLVDFDKIDYDKINETFKYDSLKLSYVFERDSNVTFLVMNNSIVLNKTNDAVLCIIPSTNESFYELIWVEI
jgi:hypothetical protein